MYKYKDKEFEIIEMTSPSNRLSWGTSGISGRSFDARDVNQEEWRTFWGISEEGGIEWLPEPPTTNTFNMLRSRQGGIYEEMRQQPIPSFEPITREHLENALAEVFYEQMERAGVNRRSAVELQRTLGIP